MTLGLTLQGILGAQPTDQPAPPAPAPLMQEKMSRGQLIAGILADALAGAQGRPGAFASQLAQQRQQQQEEVQWQRRRAAGIDDYRQKQMIDLQYGKPPEAPQIVRLQQIYDDPNTSPTVRATVKAAIDAQTNPVVTTPTGMMLRSDVIGAMGTRPPATLPPDFDGFDKGGPTPSASGTFPTSALDAATVAGESRGQRYGSNGALFRSSAGAMGEWQVMPSTARDPGFGIRPWDGASPDDLARVGREYRTAMQQRYGGDLGKMWGAYNWGPGNVDRAIAARGDGWAALAPAETQKYIRRNLSAMRGR